ncbi:MAG: nucleoside kinase [Bacteroidales bacterium]|nr:nucleoside kinase [Candidatus Cacconaster merdequi]
MKEVSIWRNLMAANNIETLNQAIASGQGRRIIHLSETLHEHKYSDIANAIAEREDVKLVLIAGPSSSGKTTSAKRLALHMRVDGLNPIVISLDDYFRNRVDTPKDEKGEYDFECLEALDVDFLNEQLKQLFAGEEVEMPRYDFPSGERKFVGDKLRMKENDVLIMEGIHGLNPALTPLVSDKNKFKIYVSVLTPLAIDLNTTMYASDYRLLRRMVRDNQFRGTSPESTILRWPSVLSGEQKYIVPFKDNADAQFNSALMYEMPMLKCYAEPLLQTIPRTSPAYGEALRLLEMIRSLIAMTPVETKNIPPTSIVREFIGGSGFSY